jgi:hypothetical protein
MLSCYNISEFEYLTIICRPVTSYESTESLDSVGIRGLKFKYRQKPKPWLK